MEIYPDGSYEQNGHVFIDDPDFDKWQEGFKRAEKLVESVSTNGNGKHSGAPKLEIYDLHEFMTTDPPPVQWMVRGLFAKEAITLLGGREGTMKSLLCMALAGGILRGETVADFECTKGTVLYIDAENGKSEMHRRWKSLGMSESGLTIAGSKGLDLEKPKDFDEVLSLVREGRPDLLILDSMRSLHPNVDENDSGKVGMLLDRLRHEIVQPYQTAVSGIHHHNKGDEYRGTTGWGAGVDIVASLRKFESIEGKPRRLRFPKMRIGAEQSDRGLVIQIEDNQVFIEACDPPRDEDEPKKKAAPKRIELRPKVLGAHDPGEVLKLADLCQRVGVRSLKDGSVRRTRDLLVDEGLLERVDGSTRLTAEGARCQVPEPTALGTSGTAPIPSTSPYNVNGEFA